MFLYIDATSGGMILQVLLSGFVGIFVVLKLFWHRIVDFVLRRKPAPTEEPAASANDETVPTQ
jgi:hypothetical protein